MYSYCDAAAVLDSSSISCKFFLVLLCCVSVFTLFFCSQQFVHSKNLSVFIVDVVPPKCQGKLKIFEGVRPQAVVASRNFSKSLQ